MTRRKAAGAIGGGLLLFGAAIGIAFAQISGGKHSSAPVVQVGSSGSPTAVTAHRSTSTSNVTTTTVPCSLSVSTGTAPSVPVNRVCSAVGAPHFDTPQSAMTYLADAWNSGNVQAIDYVTDPAGRQQMDSMASLMVNLQFKYCTGNPAGDYTCYFSHNVTPSTSPTTYPNPGGYPPGEAVFTVAPAAGPGWYLTNVVHCG